MKKILVTGSCGFIFSNFIQKVLKEEPDYTFVGIDKLVNPYNFHNLVSHPNYRFYPGDIADDHFIDCIFRLEKPDIVINGAAESFVCASIVNAKPFIDTNVYGTQVLTEAAIKYGVDRFVQISTDEVYGHLRMNDAAWTEETSPLPRNPYSVSKYASELVVYAANQAHGLQYNITRSCNVFGPRQPFRNLVPVVIGSIFDKMPVPIHGTGLNRREWLYVENKCDAIMHVVKHAPANETYNIGPGLELSNLEMVEAIGKRMKRLYHVQHVEDRKGHDFRYSIDCTKIKDLGWTPKFDFETGLEKTLAWYENNQWYFDP